MESDGATLIPWVRGKPLAWDVTVTDTYAASHIVETAECAGAGAPVIPIDEGASESNLIETLD